MFKKTPNIVSLDQVLRTVKENQSEINGRWVPTRHEGYRSFKYRCLAAFAVFTGKADALIWPEGQ